MPDKAETVTQPDGFAFTTTMVRCPKCGFEDDLYFCLSSITIGDDTTNFCIRCLRDFLLASGVPTMEGEALSAQESRRATTEEP